MAPAWGAEKAWGHASDVGAISAAMELSRLELSRFCWRRSEASPWPTWT